MPGERVLVVEDTELLRRIYHDRLIQEGYSVAVAADGLDAIQQMRAVPVDLVLLDLIMPRMGGLEVLETMRSDPRLSSIPVIVLTNLGEETSVERAIQLGAADYLIKNQAKPAEVVEKIQLVLEHLGGSCQQTKSYKLLVRDRQADADCFIADARLPRRFWCPACEVELVVELVPQPDREGWYDAHVVCPMCAREF